MDRERQAARRVELSLTSLWESRARKRWHSQAGFERLSDVIRAIGRSVFGARVPIFHIASMARSGETAVLRSLSAHTRVRVVHNLTETEDKKSRRLFRYLKQYKSCSLRCSHPYARYLGLSGNEVLILKQGVWEHKHRFVGVVLVRNPVSVFASLKAYDQTDGEAISPGSWAQNEKRLVRWSRDIDRRLATALPAMTPVEQFCAFYVRRMEALLETGLPVLHYERLVEDPALALERVLACAGLPWEDGVAMAHTGFRLGEIGHGQNELSRPINGDSLTRYRKLVSIGEFDEIATRTSGVTRAYGYRLDWDAISVESEGTAFLM